MATFQQILVATDFSEHSEAAARRGAELAERLGADLTLLHVVEYFPADLPINCIAPEDVDPEHYLQERSAQLLNELAERIGATQAKREVIVSNRAAKHTIVDFAEEHGNDLIIIGAHGAGMLSALLGSTANGVLHCAPCDVLVTRA